MLPRPALRIAAFSLLLAAAGCVAFATEAAQRAAGVALTQVESALVLARFKKRTHGTMFADSAKAGMSLRLRLSEHQ